MIIIGAKGFAKEILQIISVDMNLKDSEILFFDNVNSDLPEKIYNRFNVLRSFQELESYFKKQSDRLFALGLGNPQHRFNLYKKMITLGGIPHTIISDNSEIGSFDVKIGDGTSVLSGSKISNSVILGIGCLVYYNSILTHDCIIGDFVEISPNVIILGRCRIGDYSRLGAGAIILPDVKIGNNVTIGAGSVVTKNIPDNALVFGVPAIVKGEIEPFNE